MLRRFDGANNVVDVANVWRFDGNNFVNCQSIKRFDGTNWIDVWNDWYFAIKTVVGQSSASVSNDVFTAYIDNYISGPDYVHFDLFNDNYSRVNALSRPFDIKIDWEATFNFSVGSLAMRDIRLLIIDNNNNSVLAFGYLNTFARRIDTYSITAANVVFPIKRIFVDANATNPVHTGGYFNAKIYGIWIAGSQVPFK